MIIQKKCTLFAALGLLAMAGCSDAGQDAAVDTETTEQTGMEGGMQNPHTDLGPAPEGMPNPHTSGAAGAGAMGAMGGMENPHAAGGMPGEDGIINITFKCPDDVPLQLVLHSADNRAEVIYMGETHELERVRSGSGMKFSDGTWGFFSKGPEAMLMKNEEPIVKNCIAAGHP